MRARGVGARVREAERTTTRDLLGWARARARAIAAHETAKAWEFRGWEVLALRGARAYAERMATIIVRESDLSMFLLEAGKLVALDPTSTRPGNLRRDALYVSDDKWETLAETFGPVIL